MPDYISIRTAQNVDITYKLAGLGSRVLARVLDYIIITAYIVFVVFLFAQLGDFSWIMLIFLFPVMFYSLIFEALNDGQTPGKNITRTKVVSLDGSELSISQILIRWLLLLVDSLLLNGLVGLISIAATKNQQRLGDLAASTIVISLKEKARLEDTGFVKVEENYEPVYTEASQLSEQDVRILQSILSDRSEKRFEHIKSAASKIEDLLHVTSTSSSESFLKNIIKDYNYYQNVINKDEFLY